MRVSPSLDIFLAIFFNESNQVIVTLKMVEVLRKNVVMAHARLHRTFIYLETSFLFVYLRLRNSSFELKRGLLPIGVQNPTGRKVLALDSHSFVGSALINAGGSSYFVLLHQF